MSNPLGGVGRLLKRILPTSGIVDTVAQAVDMVTTSPQEREALKAKLREIEIREAELQAARENKVLEAMVASDKNQTQLNMEAVKRGFSWRDMVGWGLAVSFSVSLLLVAMSGFSWMGFDPAPVQELWHPFTGAGGVALAGLLGLGAMRTAEKMAVFRNGHGATRAH